MADRRPWPQGFIWARTLWKPVDSCLLGLINVPGSVIGMFMSMISVNSWELRSISILQMANRVQTAYLSRVQTVRGRTEFKSNLDPIPKPGGGGWGVDHTYVRWHQRVEKKKKIDVWNCLVVGKKKIPPGPFGSNVWYLGSFRTFLWENLRFKVGKPFIQPQITFFLIMNHCLIAVLVALTIS